MQQKPEDYQLKILKLLEEKDLGLNISQIAQEINLNRNSTSKYLEIMAERNLIYKREEGPTRKLFYPIHSLSYEVRAEYIIKFYHLLHASLFIDILGDPKKAREIGIRMAKRGGTALYKKQFENVELTFESILPYIGIAVELTYPTPSGKAKVILDPEDSNSAVLEIENCLCMGNPEYHSICEIQAGLLKGIMDELLEPNQVEIEEIECITDGFGSCKYTITKK